MTGTAAEKWIAMFPGQGAQHVGMARELHDNFAPAREAFEEASDGAHLNLRKLCFEGPESDLALTEFTQPCLLTASVAAFRSAQREFGLKPSCVAGHSLGEYSALVAAEALTLGTAAAWVRERGKAMQQAVPPGQGGMAAVMGLDDQLVEELCLAAAAGAQAKRARGEQPAIQDLAIPAVCAPANFNGPGQIVIAGANDAIAEAVALITGGGPDGKFSRGKAMPLQVSAPFHSPLMAPAREAMSRIFTGTPGDHLPRALACPYVPNRTARLTSESGLVLELLMEQIDGPVLWRQSIESLLKSGFTRAIEFGPGRVLQGLCKRIAQPLAAPLVLSGVSDKNSLQELGKNPPGGLA